MNKEEPKKIEPQNPNKNEKVKTLDDLIEVLDQDDLRHVIGGGRPKGPPHAAL